MGKTNKTICKQIRMERELASRLEAYCRLKDLELSQVMRRAIRELLEREGVTASSAPSSTG